MYILKRNVESDKEHVLHILRSSFRKIRMERKEQTTLDSLTSKTNMIENDFLDL